MRTIAAQWDIYRTLVMPAEAGPIQMQETRRAFYAGAESMLSMVNGLGDESVSEDAGMAALQGLQEEVAQFAREVQRGKA